MKARRQKKILEIIQSRDVSTQDELAEALKNAGFIATQATISRDIKELRLVKIAAGGRKYRYGIPKERDFQQNEERLRRMLQEAVVSVNYSGNIVVLRTYPGNAQAVASLIDGAAWPEVIGTVAGDDTILLVVALMGENRPHPETERLLEKLQSLME